MHRLYKRSEGMPRSTREYAMNATIGSTDCVEPW